MPTSETERSTLACLGVESAASVQWAVESLSAGDTPERREAARAVMAPIWRDPTRVPRLLDAWGKQMGPGNVVEARRTEGQTVEAVIVDERGRRWVLRCELEEAGSRIRTVGFSRELPPGVRIRPGREADLDGILAVDLACPIVRSDGTRVTIDRGARWFEWLRLQDRASVVVAEAEGRVIAVDAGALRDVCIAGRDYVLIYRQQSRVLPEWQRLGVLMALTAHGAALRSPFADGGISFVDPRNDRMNAMIDHLAWSFGGFRAQLPCAALAGPRAGRIATVDDAERIVALLNATHAGSEVFVPYTTERLSERLGRAPASYGWRQLRLGDRAVLGVWPAMEHVVVEGPAGRRESVRALALDWGFEGPRGLDELETLLRGACADLAGAGATHLSVFASDAAPGASRLRELAESVAPFRFMCMIAEPPGAAERGLYVDPIYF